LVMGGTWIARPYRPGDEEGILQLRRLVFGEVDAPRNTVEYWRWEYVDAPAGRATIWVGEAEGSIVGHYAIRPVKMQHRGEPVLGSTSIDAMTHPHYRRESVFATLGQRAYAELAQDGPALTYIFPRKISMAGSIAKFDWKYLCALSVFVKPIDVNAVVERFISGRAILAPVRAVSRVLLGLVYKGRRRHPQERGEVRWLERFDDRVDRFWAQLAPRYPIAVVRDSSYLNWRYFDNPSRDYRALAAERGGDIISYAILRRMEQFGLRGGMIVDLGALPGCEGALAALLDRAEELFREEQMDVMACLVNGDERYVQLLRQRGFRPLPSRLGFKQWYFGYRINNPRLDEEVCADRSNWFLTFGDTDVV
jgi:hypothetical protein